MATLNSNREVHLLKPLLWSKTSKELSMRKRKLVSGMALVLLWLILKSNFAIAGGAATGGATEWTQILNFLQSTEAVAQHIISTQQLIMQTEMMVRNLQDNPLAVIAPSLDTIIRNQATINQLNQDIDGNWKKVGGNALNALKNPKRFDLGTGAITHLEAAKLSDQESELYDRWSKMIAAWRSTTMDEARKQDALNNELAHASSLGAKAQTDATNHLQAEVIERLRKLNALLTEMQAAEADQKTIDAARRKAQQNENDRLMFIDRSKSKPQKPQYENRP